MFALITAGTISGLVDVIPSAPDPLPDGYIAPDYRPVVDGAAPAITTGFSSVIEKPLTEWTIQPTQVVRTFAEYIPPLSDCRAIADARCAILHHTSVRSGITIGGVTLEATDDARDKFIGKYLMLDALVRRSAISLTAQTSISDKDGAQVTLTVQQMLDLLLAYGVAYESMDSDRRAKRSQIKTATTREQLTSIT